MFINNLSTASNAINFIILYFANPLRQVVSIIESRARTMDMTVNKFYDLLFSYHTIKSDYRKAATTMYEQACRLQTEMHGLKSLQKQVWNSKDT